MRGILHLSKDSSQAASITDEVKYELIFMAAPMAAVFQLPKICSQMMTLS